MPVQITTRHGDLPSDFQDLVIKKVRKLKKYFDKVDRIEVIFDEEKHRKMCEIIVSAGPLGATSKDENGDFGPAFEKALKKCERQIKEQKRRMIERSRSPKAHEPLKSIDEAV